MVLSLPMPVGRVVAHERIVEDRGKVALQRGPIVYCVEGRDADVPLSSVVPAKGELSAAREPDLLGGIVTVRGRGFKAIPYHAWANRGPGPMRVWLRGSR